MSDTYLYDKLVILNSIYNNTINLSREIIQDNIIKTPLFPHQKLMINAMFNHRERMTRGFLYGNQAINGKLGIIGDPPGTGKTLSILSYIAEQKNITPKITCELSNHSTKYFFSHEFSEVVDNRLTNLIIVPHILFNYWRTEISKHTNMKYVAIETRKHIRGNNLVEEIVTSSFVLTTSKCYKHIQAFAAENNIKWNNIFIDEATAIYLSPSDPQLKFQFLWLVTSNWIPLIFKNASIIRSDLYHIRDRVQIHPELESWLRSPDNIYESSICSNAFFKDYLPYYHNARSFIILRNDKLVIDNSIKIPIIERLNLRCKPNITIQSLINYFKSKGEEPVINTNNIPYLFQSLSINFNNLEQFLETQNIVKHNLIRRKREENECVICMEKAEYPTIVNCCSNIYCGKCILTNIVVNQKCPTCRDVLTNGDICCIDELNRNQIIPYRSKTDTCIDIIRNNTTGRFIIYTAFMSSYFQMYQEFDKYNIKAERLENNLFSLLKSIKNFNEGKCNVLFISNIDSIRGLSLSSASHLIFLHEQPSYELKQVLIHSAQRIGRKDPLKIVHLNSELTI